MNNHKDEIKKGYDLHSNGQLQEAESIYKNVLHVNKENIEVQYLLGLVKYELGKLHEAYDLIKKVCKKNNSNSDYLYNLSLISLKLEKKKEALTLAQRLISLAPNNSLYYKLYAECLQRLGRYQEAIDTYKDYEKIAKHVPEEIILNQGLLLTDIKKYIEAESKFKNILKINPDSIDAVLGIAKINLLKKKYTRAVELLNKLSNKHKDNKKIEIMRANAYLQSGDLNNALSIITEILKKNKNDLAILNNIGYILREMENYSEAKEYFKKIIKLDPKHINANVNLGLILLSEKSYKEGWKHYQFRNSQESVKNNTPKTNSQKWNNKTLHNKKVLVWTEQGLGDEILQASLVNDLRDFVDELTVLCSERLLTVFERSFPNVNIFSKNNPAISSMNFQDHLSCPLLDTAIFLRSHESKFSNLNNYLLPDKNKKEILRNRYLNLIPNQPNKPIVIGISWRSENEKYGIQNTIKLENWHPFFNVIKNMKRNIVLLSTQYKCCEEELEYVYKHFGIEIYLDKEIEYSNDLDSPISQIASCDYIISTSTTTAQIAGALGKKIWHLPSNGISCGWYWLHKGDKTPWYPQMTHIRRKGNNISAQLKKLSEEISRHFKNKELII